MPTTLPLHAAQCATAPDRASEPSPIKFHISLNVADLARAVDFYRVLFGVEPAKRFDDYAKFELTDPPLVLSLEPQPHAPGGALNHLGFRLSDARALVDVQRRLETAGIPTTREDGVECCHARQTKFWVNDPDRNNWEMYVLEADIEPHGSPARTAARPAAAASNAPPTGPLLAEVSWEHQLGVDFPPAIPLVDAAADRVLLRGTFNSPLTSLEIHRILTESRRVLRPGGLLQIHGLVADKTLTGASPALPGPAAAVKHVPVDTAIFLAVEQAGFASLRIVKYSATPVFVYQGIPLRELLLEAIRLDASPLDLQQTVLYKGPLRQVIDDAGHVYPRGQRVLIPGRSAELLRSGPLAESFVFLL